MAHHNDVYKANVLKLEAEFFKLTKIFNNSKHVQWDVWTVHV